MNKISLLFSLMMLSFSMMASTTWNLQGYTYDVDTLFHAKIGPGTTQTSLVLAGNLNLRVFYTTTDLSDENVEVRVAKAGNRLQSVATVPNLAKSNTKAGELYFAGVNGDFFNTANGQPNGTNILNSEIYNIVETANWLEWSIDADKKQYLGKIHFTGSVKKADGTSLAITNINTSRGENHLTLYSQRIGSSTGTNQYGTEILATPIESGATIALGKTIKMKIVGAPSSAGNMTIPAGSYVLSGHGTSKTFVEGLTDGEKIEVSISTTTNEGVNYNPKWSIGGCPVILKGGVVQETENANIISHLPNKEPRTAIGYDATGTKVIMLVVDGRSSISDGCRTKVLADIMREVGCTEAMNFDGGGSSTLYAKEFGDNGVCNVPSQGALRAVTNGVFAVAVCPDDTEIAEIRFKEFSTKVLPKYGYFKPEGFYGYNKYGVLVSTDVQGVKLSCSTELGEIVNDGTTLNASGFGAHALTATYNGATATLPIVVENTVPRLEVESVTLDKAGEFTVETVSTVDNEDIALNNIAFTWSSSNTSIATVDANGVVKALKEGTAIIKGEVNGNILELTVNIEIPTDRYRAVDLGTENAWTSAGENIESSSIETVAGGGFNLKFTPSATKQVSIDIVNGLASWSRPDSICIEVNPGEAKPRYMYILGIDQANPNDSVEYKLNVNGKILQNTNNKITVAMSDFLDTEYTGSFPFTLTGIRFSFLSINKEEYTFNFPKISWLYDAVPSGIESINAGDNALTLCPNPVTAGTAVSLGVSEPVNYTVNSLNGAQVAAGNGIEIATDGLAAGIYVVSAKVNGTVKTAKLIVK